LRLSNDAATGSTLTNPTLEMSFPISGISDGFQVFETSLLIADEIRSFDLTFISGGALGATGSLFVDDISAAIQTAPPSLPGDFNGDGLVDAADYVVWRKGLGTTYTPNHYQVWRANFGQRPEAGLASQPAAPEPSSISFLIVTLTIWFHARGHNR
jgi:hypothetical protein